MENCRLWVTRFQPAAGWVITTSHKGSDLFDSDIDNKNGSGTTGTIHLNAGEHNNNLDLGLYKCATISGDVWLDKNINGIYDKNEKGINGVKVYVVDVLNKFKEDTIITGFKPGSPLVIGYFNSPCLKPGVYYLRFQRPGHLAASPSYKGNDPNKDCDITNENGRNTTRKITVMSGDIVTYIGGGFQDIALGGDGVKRVPTSLGNQESTRLPISGGDNTNRPDTSIHGDNYVEIEVPNIDDTASIPRVTWNQIKNGLNSISGKDSTNIIHNWVQDTNKQKVSRLVSQVFEMECLNLMEIIMEAL